MSMLTPPGMGGQYRIKGDRYPRMRRPRNRHRLVFASVGTAAAVGLIGWGSLELIDAFTGGGQAGSSGHSGAHACAADAKPHTTGDGKDGEDGETAEPGKSAKPPKSGSHHGSTSSKDTFASGLPKPGSIKVNVLNATDRSGLAKTTSEELKKRGFKIGKVTNAPAALDKKVKSKGVLLGATGAQTTDKLKVLGTQLKGADARYDERKGDDVDLVLGDKFKKLTKKKGAASALATLADPSPSPARSAGHCPS